MSWEQVCGKDLEIGPMSFMHFIEILRAKSGDGMATGLGPASASKPAVRAGVSKLGFLDGCGESGHRAGTADGLALGARPVPGPLSMGPAQALEVGARPGLLEAHDGTTTVGDHRASIDLEGEALTTGHGVASIPGDHHAPEGVRTLELGGR